MYSAFQPILKKFTSPRNFKTSVPSTGLSAIGDITSNEPEPKPGRNGAGENSSVTERVTVGSGVAYFLTLKSSHQTFTPKSENAALSKTCKSKICGPFGVAGPPSKSQPSSPETSSSPASVPAIL